MGKLTPKRMEVLRELNLYRAVYRTPTQIGEGCGLAYHAASAWACGALSALVAAGLVEQDIGRYRITKAGRAALEANHG